MVRKGPLTTSRKYAAVLLATLAGAAVAAYSVRAQPEGQIPRPATQPGPAAPSLMNHNLVVLDPAHGGPDTGGTVGDHIVEKDVTLAMAVRLRAALTAAGFTVVFTRDADGPDPLPTDQRAEIANRTHAVACIVLHATAIGSGVHVYTSTLPSSASPQNADTESPFVPIPWDMAQAASVDQSQRLASDLKAALSGENLPVVIGRAPVRPLDNLMCPAVAIELAPLAVAGVGATPVTDVNYQQSVASTVTAALRTWRGHAEPQ